MKNLKHGSVVSRAVALLVLVALAGINLFCERVEKNAETLADQAQAKLYQEWDWAGAEQAFQQALERDPKLGRAHAHYSWYLQLMGRFDEAVTEMKRACEVEPQAPLWRAWLGWLYLGDEQYDKAIAEARTSLEISPDFPVGLYVLGLAYSAQGMYDQAIEMHEKAGAADPRWRAGLGHSYALAGRKEDALKIATELSAEATTWDTWGLAEIYAALDEKDEAIRWLEQAYEQRHPYFPWIGWNPHYETLQDDPRFQDLLQRVKLPELTSLN